MQASSSKKIILMKKALVFVLFSTVFFTMKSAAQEKKELSLLLTNYTFSKGRNLVGQVVASNRATVKKVKLRGDAASAFKISKGNQISILATFNKPEVQWHDLVLEAETSAGTIVDTFRIVNDQFHRNKVIAHRGAWKNTGATENSIASLKHAIELGCEGSEFDIHLSADSIPYILHDHSIGGINIEESPSSVLSQVKLSNGESLPTLEDYIKAGLNQNKTKLILEIKPSKISKERAITLTNYVVKMVKDLKAQGWVEYISFDYGVCKEILRLNPFAKIAYLNGEKSPEELASDKITGLDYHQSVFQKNENWIKEAHQKGLTVNVWTVNDPKLMDWFLDHKADFITTNEPEILLKKVKGN
jgi:glycerophosphoryl diester phosphodiesterase